MNEQVKERKANPILEQEFIEQHIKNTLKVLDENGFQQCK
jgi:hypothetical protein